MGRKIHKKIEIKGTETLKIKSFDTLKKIMLDLIKGYPEYEYMDKIEYFFAENKEKVIETLNNDNIIEAKKYGKQIWYRLTPKGINLAISMINLDHSEKVLNYSKEVKKFTEKIHWLTILLIMIGLGNFLLIWLQISILV